MEVILGCVGLIIAAALWWWAVQLEKLARQIQSQSSELIQLNRKIEQRLKIMSWDGQSD